MRATIACGLFESGLVQRGGNRAHRRLNIQSPLPADSVEKQRVAGAESKGLNGARAPFLSGFARLLRCRKDLG